MEETGQNEVLPRREATDEELQAKVQEGVEYFLDKVAKTYGKREDLPGYISQEFPRSFHKLEHTKSNLAIADQMIEAIKRAPDGDQVPTRQLIVAPLFIAGHDSVMERDATGANRRGDNERESAQDVIAWMRKQNENDEGIIYFNEDDFTLANEGILATIPDIKRLNPSEPNPPAPAKPRMLLTIVQPHLEPTSAYSTYIVAMSDLAEPGAKDIHALVESGVDLILEDNRTMSRRLLDVYKRYTDIDNRDTAFAPHRAAIVGTMKFEYGFALGQQARFEKNLKRFPPGVQDELKKVFPNFDQTVSDAKDLYKAIDQLPTEDVLKLAFGNPEEYKSVMDKVPVLALNVQDADLPQAEEAALAAL